ncbi:CHAT domain-containing protein [Micromonospora costi]|uniref:CHAT domain-containing protein n=1 Tax=Micromonospora costi TaxID=1530042 RepID=UPI0011C47148|nr:CHAT domain-containing protein [Micromonospora costi]
MLFQLAVTVMGVAERSGDYRMADQAQALLERALALTPAGRPERPAYLTALGRVHRDQFLHLGWRGGLQAAIDTHRESLESTPPGAPERAERLFHLGNVLGDRYGLTGDEAVLHESVQLLDEAARVAPDGSPLRAMARVNLAQRLRDRWRRRRDPADLHRAVDTLGAVVAGGADPRIVALHATLTAERFAYTGALGDLDAAIGANQAALAGGDLPDEWGGIVRVSLAALVGERHERRHDPADVDAAVEAYRAAVDGGPRHGGPDRAALAQAAGRMLEARYERHRRADDLHEALRLLREAVAGADDPVDRAQRLGDLGYTLGRWHADLAGVASQREAVDVLTEAARLLPARHPGRPDLSNNLGNLLRELAEQAGEHELLEPAVAALRAAVDGAGDSPKLPRYLSNLGLALHLLFGRTQDAATLAEAITVLRRAVEASPSGHPYRLETLTNYGSALNRRAELAVDDAPSPGASPAAEAAQDARTAVAALREAADLARREAEPAERALVVGTLALAQFLRYRTAGDAAALDESIALLRGLTEALPPSAPGGHRLFTNLGNALLTRFRRAPTGRDATDMLTAYRAAVAAVPDEHPDRTMCLRNLAAAIEAISGPSGDGDADPGGADLPAVDPAEATAALRAAAAVESAPSLLRAEAAERYAARAAQAGDLPAALDGYATAIELIDLVAWHGMDPDDQARLLARFPHLAGDAAAVAVAVGRPERAVELLEYGRGVLLTRAHDAGADLAALRERAPRLAARLAEAQAALDGLDAAGAIGSGRVPAVAAPAGPAGGSAGGPERRHELATRRRELLAEIRGLPGFDGFLRPPPFAELARSADGGPVVLVNVAARRCDALVVTGGRVEPVPLPDLTLDDLVGRVAAFLTAVAEVTGAASVTGSAAQRRRAAARRGIADTLDWLWRVVAAPVLDALGPAATGPDQPRVWWCPTSLLTLLPLHAAAPIGGGDGVLDRVVPSYTASLRALRHARRAVPAGAAPVTSALVVGMPQTPGLPDLPGAAREEEIVRRHVAHVTALTGPAATPAAVLAALPERPVAHLSCHGSQDLAAPTRGRLALAGGPLHVRDLWRPAGGSAALAVLSACDTVRGGARLPDEALTLGTAFQLAGFRHVIGALWSISDALTVQLCAEFYAGLAVPGGIDPERAARALHRAVCQMRAALPGLPDLWAGYVHIGP